ncbi:non-ribosomal peptide synthetase [Steroidobacter cummioxidans]|uniref:non-ribosomal peptide synthetase n=1 Tax=Steroidobacter cummioxidans TaxID=1803913 RepID=UPI00137B47DD|nr:non-ribosomal peptide synthetase [Steroidobacter cummioxidans]
MSRDSAIAKEQRDSLSEEKKALFELLLKQSASHGQKIRAYPRVVGERQDFPVSGTQQRLWFIDQLEGGSRAYHLAMSVRLRGPLDADALQSALVALVERHEALRTVFHQVDGAPVQRILTEVRCPLQRSDVRAMEERSRETRLLELCQEELAAPFDLAAGPLFRARLVCLSDDDHVLLLTMHHIVSDGWSIGVLTRELGLLYQAQQLKQPSALPALPVQYADYAQWQNQRLAGAELQRQLNYWHEQLRGAPELFELPTDRPRPAVQSYRGASVPVSIAPDVSAGVRALSRRLKLTPAMVLYAAWTIVLARLSGQTDFVMGMPVANRHHRELEGVVGFFVNTLALRVRLEGDPSAADWLEQVKASMLAAYDHQDAPFEAIVKLLNPTRNSSYSPVFQTMFVFRNTPDAVLRIPGLAVTEQPLPLHTSHFDLTLLMHEADEQLAGTINYSGDLFDAATMQRWAGCLEAVLRKVIAAPSIRISELPLMNDAERQLVLEQFNSAELARWPEQLLHERFERCVRLEPDTVAIVYEGQSLAYAALNAKANQLARQLRRAGVGPDQRVALLVERSLDLVVGLLGILKAGGAYVPLDPVHPDDRLAYMVEDSAPVALVTQASLVERVAAPARCAVFLIDEASWAASDLAAEQTDNLSADDIRLQGSHLAYVIYTSGSTGKPKGVMVEHRNVLYFIQAMEAGIHGLAPDCRHIAWNSSFGFDMAAKAWGQLLMGRTVHLLPESSRSSAEGLLAFLEEHRIEAMECTPSHLRMMQEAGFLKGRASSMRKLLLGGEAIDSSTWKLLAASEQTQFFNMYGPTECSVDASCGPIRGDFPNVGRVMHNARIYILDRHRLPVPTGVPGEIYIAGAGVARGYLNQNRLTAERFVSDPFSADRRARMYKTGDLARWRSDGTIEYVGRNDHQVKIRGFRIELGEIEAQLSAHPQVKDAVVIAREDVPGDKRLVAYVTARQNEAPDAQTLRSHLKETLPEFMLPSAFVALAAVPLTANGKLDRRALPMPDADAFVSRRYERPSGEVEEILAGIWQGLLRVERVGRHDNFFELGGHSLLIVPMKERLSRIGLAVELRSIFESATLADLAGTITKAVVGKFAVAPNLIPPDCTAIQPEMLPLIELQPEHIEHIARAVPGGAANIQDIYPLAPLQEGILFHHLLSETEGGDAYVVPCLLSVPSRERLDDFVAALQAVVDRHDVLRTAVLWEHLPQPVQVVNRHATVLVDVVTLQPDRDVRQQLDEWMAPDQQRLDLRRAPLVRLQVAADPAGSCWYVLFQLHHIVADATSGKIIVAEIAAHIKGRAWTLQESIPYRNHVAQALAYASRQDAEVFFKSKLGEIDEPTAPFALVDVHADGSHIEEHSQPFDDGLAQRLRAQARRLGVSAATLFHAAWSLVVAHTTGRNDVVFGSVLLGRLHGEAGGKLVVGMFINTLPLRLSLQGQTAKGLVELTQRELVELLSHEQASLAVAQRCSGIASSTPLFSSLLNYRHSSGKGDPNWDGIDVLQSRNGTNYPITLSVDDQGDGFSVTAQTDRRLPLQRVTGYLITGVESLVTALEREPEAPALSLGILPDQERRQVIELFNATEQVYPQDAWVHTLFEDQAARTPEARAAVYQQESISYDELNRQANRLARHLRGLGVGRNHVVGICVDRSLEMLVGLLGIMKSGAGYMPLDPSYPMERLQYMLQDAAPPVVLTQDHLQETLSGLWSGPAISLTRMRSELAAYSDENLSSTELELTPRDPVYVIYTSGSTGLPKGTAMPHRAMVNLIEWHRRHLSSEGQRVLQFAALSFDVAFQDTFTTLCTGGTLVLLDESVRRDPRALMSLLNEGHVEKVFVPPLVLQSLAEYSQTSRIVPRSVRDIIVAGEQLRVSPEMVRLFAQLNGSRLHNHYGPTETHVVTALTLAGDPAAWPALPTIGQPIANTSIYVLGEHRMPVPVGVPGEIYIAGRNVALGYLNRAELTDARFVPDPFDDAPQARMYKTGDLGCWRADGSIEYLGRNDDQVKIRGFRIELGEIEAQLALHPQVKEAAVVAREDVPGQKRLVAYVTVAEPPEPTHEQLKEFLQERLPEFMVPAAYVVLEQMPVTPSGKLNRRALPAPTIGSDTSEHYCAPEGDVEAAIAAMWSELLGVERVGRHDNFFELGGHSLHGMKLIVRVEEHFSAHLPVAAIFRHSTVSALAEVVSELMVVGNTRADEMAFVEGVI